MCPHLKASKCLKSANRPQTAPQPLAYPFKSKRKYLLKSANPYPSKPNYLSTAKNFLLFETSGIIIPESQKNDV